MATFTSLRLLLGFIRLGSLASNLPMLTPAAANFVYFFSTLGSKYHHMEVHTTAKSLFENSTKHPIIIIKTDKFIAVSYLSLSVEEPVMVPFFSADKLSFICFDLGEVVVMSARGSCGYEDEVEKGLDSIHRRLKGLLGALA